MPMTFLMELFSGEAPVFTNINQRLFTFFGNVHTMKSLFRVLDHETLYLNLKRPHNIHRHQNWSWTYQLTETRG